MAYQRPTITEIKQRVLADLSGSITGAYAWLRRSLMYVIALMITGVAHHLHGDLVWLAAKLLPDTDDPDILARWAAIIGVKRLDAVKAQSEANGLTVTGNDGETVAAGTIYQNSEGVQYEVDADITIDGATGTGSVTAVEPGADGNLEGGATLTLLAPIAGIDSEATVSAAGITGGSDIESITRWGERTLDKLRNPPQGGTENDYKQWTLAAHPDVTDVWTYPGAAGWGTITIRLMTYGATANGIPDNTVVQAVEDYINDQRAPAGARPYVFAPTAVVQDFEIQDVQPNTQAVKDAIEAELEDLIRREGKPGGTLLVSHIREAISIAQGEDDHALISPDADVAFGANEIPIMGAITWSVS